MHIELVTETYPPEINGVALTVQSLEQGLRGLGHRVALIRTEQAEESTQSLPDLMLVDGAPIPRYPGLRFGLPAGRRLQSRWNAQRPDAIYIATEGPLGWSALRAARRLGIPVATGFHTRFDDYVGRYGAGFLAPWVFAWLRRFHNRGDATLVPTLELQQQLQDQGFRHVQRLGRAVDTRQFHPGWRDAALRASWGLADDDIAVLSVGRLAPEKNLDLLVRAFRALQAQRPNAKLIFVGDGPGRAALQAANPDALFCGIQRGDELARHYASADLFLFPSLSETFGNVTLESMSSGLATVAFDYGATREHLRDGEHGAAVPFGDEAAFIAATVQVGTQASLFRQGEAARLAVQSLHPEEVARAFAHLLATLAPTRKVA
ncbi:glycosyltransferase family 4 protein [Arenimonas oryziterrae]|uniref:glycosyltransferase family 4 protein n=1 Tax=Arenimonas oryziterrae TaxID=498055 RepID=UPI0012DCB027|nr:glycosyltransferase family 1 protein [Arenimonas oryziterrae]